MGRGRAQHSPPPRQHPPPRHAHNAAHHVPIVRPIPGAPSHAMQRSQRRVGPAGVGRRKTSHQQQRARCGKQRRSPRLTPLPLVRTNAGGASPFQNLTLRKKISAVPFGMSPRSGASSGAANNTRKHPLVTQPADRWQTSLQRCKQSQTAVRRGHGGTFARDVRARQHQRTLLRDDRVATRRQDEKLAVGHGWAG